MFVKIDDQSHVSNAPRKLSNGYADLSSTVRKP